MAIVNSLIFCLEPANLIIPTPLRAIGRFLGGSYTPNLPTQLEIKISRRITTYSAFLIVEFEKNRSSPKNCTLNIFLLCSSGVYYSEHHRCVGVFLAVQRSLSFINILWFFLINLFENINIVLFKKHLGKSFIYLQFLYCKF